MKHKLPVLSNILQFRAAFLNICHEARVPYSQTKIEALVDVADGMEHRCPITDIIYDDNSNTVIVYINGSQELQYKG